MSNPEIFGNVKIAEFQVGTPCMCCGETVILNEVEARGVCLKLCDSCKDAIKFAKEMKQMCKAELVVDIHPSNRFVGVFAGNCPKCNEILVNTGHQVKFCRYCGQAVMWE